MTHLRIATYNVHKCRGLDGRLSPARIVKVLEEVKPDVAALQEVLSIERAGAPQLHQARYIAETLGLNYVIGENRKLGGGVYGNIILSRLPMLLSRNYDLTVGGHEERGCLRADLALPDGHVLHVFNVHLGTAYAERRHQGRRLLTPEVLKTAELTGPRIVLGDFNEWTRGLATQLLAAHLESADIHKHLRRRRTYPGVLPFMHLDHIYHDADLRIEKLVLHRSRTALVASDHLPLLAEFQFAA